MYVLPCSQISFKIDMSVRESTRASQSTNSTPRGASHSFITSVLVLPFMEFRTFIVVLEKGHH
jgi:hypothetical protein